MSQKTEAQDVQSQNNQSPKTTMAEVAMVKKSLTASGTIIQDAANYIQFLML